MAVENQDRIMMQAADMYYRGDMTQAEIARKLYISRTKVSRLLQEARDRKQVEIFISGQSRRNSFLEQIFRKMFTLEDVVILSGVPEDEEQAFHSVALEAARYMESLLGEDSVVGIARGRMLQAVVDCMNPQQKLPIKVVQLIGLMNNPSQNEEEMELVRKFARAYGGTYYNLFSPFILEDMRARKMLDDVAAVGKTIELARKADIILTSLGKFSVDDSNILWNSYLDEAEKSYLVEQGATGLFCGYYYDENGKIIETELHKKIIGLDVQSMIAKKHVIGVSLGEEKVMPILAALRGKMITALITEERTALNILIREGKMIP